MPDDAPHPGLGHGIYCFFCGGHTGLSIIGQDSAADACPSSLLLQHTYHVAGRYTGFLCMNTRSTGKILMVLSQVITTSIVPLS